jgi:hypothetical protein
MFDDYVLNRQNQLPFMEECALLKFNPNLANTRREKITTEIGFALFRKTGLQTPVKCPCVVFAHSFHPAPEIIKNTKKT